MNIAILAAGAAGMYCGSCMRDNALAGALRRAGHHIALIPLYTPLKTDTPDESIKTVFYGGVNTYLQFAMRVFRHTPRLFDAMFDRPWLLNFAGKLGAQTSPAKLGPFVISILKGHEGPQQKELRRLVEFLRNEIKPDIVSLPNAMFMGVTKMIHDELKVPVVCELTGEDIFLDAMIEPWKSEARDIIRQRVREVTKFVATSAYYAGKMADYLAIDRQRIEVVYPGIPVDHLRDQPPEPKQGRPPTVGYFGRICPEKGLDRLVDAFVPLRKLPGMETARLRAAGYLGSAHQEWFDHLRERIGREGLAGSFEYVGEVDLKGKLAFLDSVDVLSVPTAYEESKGIYVLEALARHVPVVQPAHGAFPELIRLTGGGVLVPPRNPTALAEQIAALLRDPARRRELGEAGHRAVRTSFTDTHMAEKMLHIYEAARK